jgi:hypothetical protein
MKATEWQFRRKLKIGESVSRSLPRLGLARLHVRYGVRIVCHQCDERLEREEKRRELWSWLEIAGLLVVLFLLLAGYLIF